MVYRPKDYSTAMPKEGDVISVTGNTSPYQTVLQFGAGATVTALDEPKVKVEHPTSEVWTAEQIDAYPGNPTRTYVKVTGELKVNDKFYNIIVDGTQVQGSIAYPTTEQKQTLNNLDRALVTVSGYAVYTTTSQGTKFMNIVATDIKDDRIATDWGVVGDLTGWGESKDIPMYTYDNNLMFAYGVKIALGSFKIRANNKWDDAKNYGMKGGAQTVYTDMKLGLETSGGSGNITPEEYGTYDIYFDLNKKLGYVMTVGKSISEAAEFKAYVKPKNKYSWGVVGSFNGWTPANSLEMTIEDDYAVAKGVTLTNGDEFKFAADKAWTLSYGSGCDVNVDEKYTAYNNGGNMKFVGDAGAYNIYFSMVEGDDSFYMEKYVETEPVETVEATITFDNTSKRTVFNNNQQVWVENGITVTNDKAASTNNVANYYKPARFYQNSKLTFTAGGEIVKIVFDCNSSSYATALKNSLGTSLGTVTVSSDKVTLVLTNPTTPVVVAKLTAQVRMDAMTVTWLE